MKLTTIHFDTFDENMVVELERFRETEVLAVLAAGYEGLQLDRELAAIAALTHSDLVKRFLFTGALVEKCRQREKRYGFADDEVIGLAPAFDREPCIVV